MCIRDSNNGEGYENIQVINDYPVMQRLESVQWQTGDYDIDLKTENIYQFIMYFNKNFHAFVRKYPGCHWYFKVKISIHQNIRNLQEFVSETFSTKKDRYNL